MKYKFWIFLFSILVNFFLAYLLLRQYTGKESAKATLIDNFARESHYALTHNYLESDLKELFNGSIVDSIDIYFNNFDPSQDQFADRFDLFTDDQSKSIKKILELSNKDEKSERDFKIMLIYYLSLNSVENLINRTYFQFNEVTVHAFPKRDTINIGEEFSAYIPLICFNSNFKPSIVLDGDTVQLRKDVHYFYEKPSRKGLIKHKGYAEFYARGKTMKLPLEFEYFVK